MDFAESGAENTKRYERIATQISSNGFPLVYHNNGNELLQKSRQN